MDHVIEELKLAKSYGFNYMYWVDDIFTVDRRLVRELCEAMVAEKLDFLWPCMTTVGAIDKKTLADGRLLVVFIYTDDERRARALAEAGVFAIVLESMPADLARRITESVEVPTIGIGAGPDCDGQVLVINDLLGMDGGRPPRFVRRFADLHATIGDAVGRFLREVEAGSFPAEAETYPMPEALHAELVEELEARDGNR